MMLTRFLSKKLRIWAGKTDGRPLLLLGARQTGKTALLRRLGEVFPYCAYFDFAENPALVRVFESTRDPSVILEGLRRLTDVPIRPRETLILLDNIALSDTAIGSLKYFYQDAPDYRVAAASTFLSIEARRRGLFLPVGALEIAQVGPLSFEEFLLNTEPALFEAVREITMTKPIPEPLHLSLNQALKVYLTVGGRPAAVDAWCRDRSFEAVDRILDALLCQIRLDFFKYARPTEAKRIAAVWDSLPQQTARRAKKATRFTYKRVANAARTREYQSALHWLLESGLVTKVRRLDRPALPLAAYAKPDVFRLFVNDPGLRRRLSRLPAETLFDARANTDCRASVLDQFVGAALTCQYGTAPFDWTSEASAAIDFVVQHDAEIVPIDVHTEPGRCGKSLHLYAERFHPKVLLRFTDRPLRQQGQLLQIPFYLAESVRRLIDESGLLSSHKTDL